MSSCSKTKAVESLVMDELVRPDVIDPFGMSPLSDARVRPRAGGGDSIPAPALATCRIAFVITGLECGGAEMMLLKLIANLDRDIVCPVVISLHGAGSLSAGMRDLDVPVYELNWKNAFQLRAPRRRW